MKLEELIRSLKWKVYLFHCTKCHHEWEGMDQHDNICDWCGAIGKYIQDCGQYDQRQTRLDRKR